MPARRVRPAPPQVGQSQGVVDTTNHASESLRRSVRQLQATAASSQFHAQHALEDALATKLSKTTELKVRGVRG